MSKPTLPAAEDYWDVHGLSRVLGLNVATIYRMRSDGRPLPPSFRVGTSVRWRKTTVEAWIAQQEAAAS